MFQKGLIILSACSFCYLIHIVTPLTYTSVKTKIIDPNIFEKLELTLEPHNGRNKFNGIFQFKVDLEGQEFDVTLDFERAPKKWIRFFHLKVDFCKFIGNNYKTNRYLQLLLKDLKQLKGFPQSCPMPAQHQPVIFKHFDTTLELPEHLPNVSFSVKLKGYTKGHLLFKITIDGFTKNYLKEKNASETTSISIGKAH